jgi:cobalamin synthase
MKWIDDFLVATQCFTRLPVPRVRFDPDSSSRAAKFSLVAGLMIGLGASFFRRIAAPHLSHPLVALLVLPFLCSFLALDTNWIRKFTVAESA